MNNLLCFLAKIFFCIIVIDYMAKHKIELTILNLVGLFLVNISVFIIFDAIKALLKPKEVQQ